METPQTKRGGYVPDTPPSDLTSSASYQLAVLIAAHRSNDRVLERIAARRLAALGIRVQFCDGLTLPDKPHSPATANGSAFRRCGHDTPQSPTR